VISCGAREMLLDSSRLVLNIRDWIWTIASPSAQETDIPGATLLEERQMASVPDQATELRLLPRVRGIPFDTGADLRHVSPHFVLPKPLQPINTLQLDPRKS